MADTSEHRERSGAAKPLRVLFSCPHALGTPGISTTAWHQAKGLVEEGLTTHVACTSVARPLEGPASVLKSLMVGPLRIPHRLLGVDNAIAFHDRIVARRLRKLRNEIDIVHCWPSGALETLRTARSLGIPSVLERPNSHTRYVYEATQRECEKVGITLPPGHYSAFNQQRLEREEAEFRIADRLLCPSDFVVETFRNEGYASEKLIRHQYGYDPAVFRLPESSRPEGRARGLHMLFVGVVYPLKGAHIALEAWHRSGASESGTFTICGDFDPSYRAALAEQLDHPSVRVVGFRDDVEDFMREADVLVLPSAAEGSALVGYEARASGAVVLVSNASGIPCEHEKNGLIHDFGDVDALSGHIRRLSENPDELARLRKDSVEGLDQLTWSAAARRVHDAYHETIAAVAGEDR